MNDKVIDFLLKVNSKGKKFEQNKYQLIIDDLHIDINDFKNEIENKNQEIELYKNNITSMQIELQKTMTDTCQLEKLHDQNICNHKVYIESSDIILLNNNKTIKKMEEEILELSLSNNKLSNLLETLSKDYTTSQKELGTISHQLKNTLFLLDSKLSMLDCINDKCKDAYQENSMFKEYNLKLENELSFIKIETNRYKNENSILRTNIFDKDIIIKKVNDQINIKNNHINDMKKVNKVDINNQSNQSNQSNQINDIKPKKILRGLTKRLI